MKLKKYEVIASCGAYSNEGWPPESFSEFVNWAQTKLLSVPEIYRKDTRFLLSSTYEGKHIDIYYYREETDEEESEREQKIKMASKSAEENERKLLAELKAKYES